MTDDAVRRELLPGDPLAVLARWIERGASCAMTLATAGADGVPHARTVLVTAIDGTGLRFHSSTPTGKTLDLAENPHASGVFHWPTLGRQVVLQGRAVELDAAVSRAAYPTRPPQLRALAWAYEELTPHLTGPDHEVGAAALEQAFATGLRRTSMPPSWTTVRFVPDRVDFWQAGAELAAPSRTRFVLGGTGWRSFPVLP